MTLAKPLAVLHRSVTVSPRQANMGKGYHHPDEEEMDVDDEGNLTSPRQAVGWDVVAIVKRKIIFSKRPMPLVGRITT
jgi:chromosome transmission fidelity protein 8